MIHDFFKSFREQQEAKIKAIETRLGNGGVTDWPDYQLKVGEIRGRRQAILDATDTVTRLSKEEKLEDGSS